MSDNRTTELREKLDELGIEHFDYDKGGRTQTQWEAPDGKRHFTYETSDNPAKTARLVIAWHPTPDQAIAATFGNSRAERTCECVADYAESPFDGKTIVLHRCSACHELMRPHMRYCPNCGCKVVGE